jgi:hypothetical protein
LSPSSTWKSEGQTILIIPTLARLQNKYRGSMQDPRTPAIFRHDEEHMETDKLTERLTCAAVEASRSNGPSSGDITTNTSGCTPLTRAALYGNTDVGKRLLEQGADHGILSRIGHSVLCVAAIKVASGKRWIAAMQTSRSFPLGPALDARNQPTGCRGRLGKSPRRLLTATILKQQLSHLSFSIP